MPCYKKWDKFEVQIIGETGHYYKVLYNNGDKGMKSKAKMNVVAEYYKLICIYNQHKAANAIDVDIISNPNEISTDSSHPISRINDNLSLSAADTTSVTNINSFDSASPPSTRKCNVCKQKLNDSNWHRCHGCGKDLHGKIICTVGKRIIDEDGIIYCGRLCKMLIK